MISRCTGTTGLNPCRCGATGCSSACSPTSVIHIGPQDNYIREPNKKDRRTYLKFIDKKVGKRR